MNSSLWPRAASIQVSAIRLVANLDPEVRHSGWVHIAAFYCSARPVLHIRIHHCTSWNWVSVVSFAATALCVVSRQMFILVCVACDLWFFTGYFEGTLTSNLSKLHCKCMKCSKQLLVTMSWVQHKLLSGFSWFKHRETSSEHSEQSRYPFTGHTDENMEKVHKIINED